MGIYARILRTPGVLALITATTVTRLPFAINGLAIVLFLRETTGSFAIAGIVAGAFSLGAACGAPLAGRLVDRRGTRMLLPLACVHAAALLAIWALGAVEGPAAALSGAALLAGSAFPPTGAVLRSRWPDLLANRELVSGAYALDSVTIEISFVSGPLLTAATVALTGPGPALGVSAALVLVGTLMFLARLPRDLVEVSTPESHRGILGALSEPAIRAIALTTAPVGFCLGAIEVALPAFASEQGAPALAGVLLAAWSLASGVGGLVYGARHDRGGSVETYLAIGLVLPLVCLPIAVASSPVAMLLAVALAGAPIAPLIASRNQIVGAIAPPGTGAESFTWLMTALIAGAAGGAAVSGSLIEAEGWPAAVLLGCAVAGVGAVLSFALRGALRPRYATG